MLGLVRNAPKHATVPLTRSLAEVVPSAPIAKRSSIAGARPLERGRVPVREDHGLWAFFRRKKGEDLVGEARYETLEHPVKMEYSKTGRAWKASELRLKSFEDLHTLWYVVLRERNLLATQKEETRRMGVSDTSFQVYAERVHQCRKTMARIKAVLNERRLAYEGAMKLVEEQGQKDEDEVVLQYQREQHEEGRKRMLLSRRELTKRRREARLKQVTATEQAQAEEVETLNAGIQADEPKEGQPGAGDVQAEADDAAQVSGPAESQLTSSESSKDMKAEKAKEVRRQTPANPADAAADALFGGAGR
ncbi:hypothetical protein APHAL10511_002686 [Amanita phalloides]|nr:hypothetical protein APHAL10511_002686 [Amanita phalloides]